MMERMLVLLNSMTGYGRRKVENDEREITVEIRSVNHRYLDLTIKVPRIYSFLEDQIKKRVSSSLARGKVDIYVSVRTREGSDIRITPNKPVIEGYIAAFREIARMSASEEDISPMTLMRLPDAMTMDKEEADGELLSEEVFAVLEEALTEYNAMRTGEGERLCRDILARADLIEGYVNAVEARSPNAVMEYRERIAARMDELLDGSELAQQRILSEAALFADKVSVTEEMIRLRSHLTQLRAMVQERGALGRKLDFLIQELNREANTIGSKASDYEIAKIVIDLKAEIEKIREQVQNLE